MANEILSRIKVDVDKVNTALIEAQELISALKEAGEDVSTMEMDIRDLERRKMKWEKMLQARGI